MSDTITLKRVSPVQGERSVSHHFTQYQQQFTTVSCQPTLSLPHPSHLHPFCTEDRKQCKQLLSHTIILTVPLPILAQRILGFSLPLSKKITFIHEQEYAASEQCHYCHGSLKKGGLLVSFSKGAVWGCGCHLESVNAKQVAAVIPLLDWWYHAGWWQSLFDNVLAKKQPPPFCSTLLFIAMSDKLIEQEGFHKANEHRPTRDRLRSLWWHDVKEHHPSVPVLSQMVLDALHPERWPQAIEKAQAILDEAKQTRNINWLDKINAATKKPWVDLRDNLFTGILAAIPGSLKNRQVNSLPNNGKNSSRFGAIKQRGALKLRILQQDIFEKREYPIKRILMINDDHQLFRWDASLSSAPELILGKWYTVTGTIRGYIHSHQGEITQLYHCTSFIESTQEDAAPPFLPPKKVQSKRDLSTLTWQLHDENGRINGVTYAQINRVWLESEKQCAISCVVQWPFNENTINLLYQEMRKNGITRKSNTLEPQFDKGLIALVKKNDIPEKFKSKVCGHWVDDAYAHPHETHMKETARDSAPPNERQWRKPHWFFDSALALSHARRLTMGRWLTLQCDNPTLIFTDLNLRGSPSYPDFLDAARRRGINFMLSEGSDVVTPLSLQGMTILERQHAHAQWPNQAHYTLKGKNLLIFSKLTPCKVTDPALLLQPHPASINRQPPHVSVRDIVNGSHDQARMLWHYIAADEITIYYLKKLGCRCWVVTNDGVDIGEQILPLPTLSDPNTDLISWTRWLVDAIEKERDPFYQSKAVC